jgi:ribosomal protein L37AE/L43A
MPRSVSQVTAVLLDDEPDILRAPTCPMCHTSVTLSQGALEASGDWRCVRCGQHWDAARLVAVAAYAAWTVDHDRAGRRATDDTPEAPLGGRGGRDTVPSDVLR